MSITAVPAVLQALGTSPLIRDGLSWIGTGGSGGALQNLLDVGREFFEGPAADRESIAANTTMTGWRRIGIEYSVSASRPDLNETFCYRFRDDAQGVLPEATRSHPLVVAARAAQAELDVLAEKAMDSIAEYVGRPSDAEKVRHKSESWLQMNWSRPASAQRDFIQDAHEDGHLVTLLFADAEGLEVLHKLDGWIEVLPNPSEVICFAGECGAFLSGDAVYPMMHRVRARGDVATRLSVAYFVNPDLDQQLDPWVPNDRNQGVDLLSWGQQNPARFGLPTL
jgi:isopenicillin N synthase-like dioxygenase